jgi:hypothetical protein
VVTAWAILLGACRAACKIDNAHRAHDVRAVRRALRSADMTGMAWLLLFVNLGISWWNARVVGLEWVESQFIGGYIRFMCWMGWLMSALVFTWCYVLILALFAHNARYIDASQMTAAISLGYVVVLPGLLVSGTFIWVDSVVQAWRRRDLPSIATATWNTFAEIHNINSAVSGIGPAFKSIGGLFSDADEDEAKIGAIIVVVLIVVAALAGGVITTELIRRHYAASRPLPERAVPQPQPA